MYLFKVNNRNTRKKCEICSKLKVQFKVIVNFEHTSHLFLVFLLLTLNKKMLAKNDVGHQCSRM